MATPKQGGILKGRKHAQCGADGCGIKIQAGPINKEAEGGEFLLCQDAMQNAAVITASGTKRQIAEKINGSSGTVTGNKTLQVNKGQYVINAAAMVDKDTFTVTGTRFQIASAINADKGYGIEFAPGATITSNTKNLKKQNNNIMATKKKTAKPQKKLAKGGKVDNKEYVVQKRIDRDSSADVVDVKNFTSLAAAKKYFNEQLLKQETYAGEYKDDNKFSEYYSETLELESVDDDSPENVEAVIVYSEGQMDKNNYKGDAANFYWAVGKFEGKELVYNFYDNGRDFNLEYGPIKESELDTWYNYPRKKLAKGGSVSKDWGTQDDFDTLYLMFPDNHAEAKAFWNKLSNDQQQAFINNLHEGDAASEHIAESWEEFINAKSQDDYWENATNWDEMAKGGGVSNVKSASEYDYWRDKKILGHYEVKNKDIDTVIEIVGFENDGDKQYLYQPTDSPEFKRIGSIIVPNQKMGSLQKGEFMNFETTSGLKVKIKRIAGRYFYDDGTAYVAPKLAKGGAVDKSDTTTTKLAKEFSAILRSWLTPEQLTEINQKNETAAYTNADATHDYCDPNQAMIDAFEKVFGKEIDFQSDEDSEIINTAWALARKNKFYVEGSGTKLAKGGPVANTKRQNQIAILKAAIAGPVGDAAYKAEMQVSLDKLLAADKKEKPAKAKTLGQTSHGAIIEYADVEPEIISELENQGELTTSDAQGILLAHEDFAREKYGLGFGADQIAKSILSKSSSKPAAIDKNKEAFEKMGLHRAYNPDVDYEKEWSDYEKYNKLTNQTLDFREATDWNKLSEDFKADKAGSKKSSSKTEPKQTAAQSSGKTGPDLVKYVEKQINSLTNKPIYFKGNAGSWIKGKIESILPTSSTKEHWNIEFYPVGAGKEMETPMVSDKLTTKQVDELQHGSEIKNKYTLVAPESEVIKDFESASKEIDLCFEESKATRVNKQRTNPPVKKKPAEILKNKQTSYKKYAISRIEKKDPKKVDGLKKMLDRHEKEIDAYLKKKSVKLAKGGGVDSYIDMYFGKGYEAEALPELKKALPNFKVELTSKHKFSIYKNDTLVATIETDNDKSKYGWIKNYSPNGEYIGGTAVDRLADAITDIKLNQ